MANDLLDLYDKEIEDLKHVVAELEDIVKSYKKQLKDAEWSIETKDRTIRHERIRHGDEMR